ncbi:MAG: hypothetical protein ACYCXT_11445 [Acidiferrobacteraceae bacterium]
MNFVRAICSLRCRGSSQTATDTDHGFTGQEELAVGLVQLNGFNLVRLLELLASLVVEYRFNYSTVSPCPVLERVLVFPPHEA